MKKIFNSRFFSVIILLLAVSTLFTACMGGAKVQEVSKSVTNYDGSVNSLKQEELNAIATKLYNNAEAKNAFFAAYRGYDLIGGQYANDFDFSENLGVNYEYVQKVITKYAGITFAEKDEDVTPEEGAGDATTPEEGTGDATTPEEGAGDATTPEEGAGDATTPEEGTGDATTPEEGAGDATTPEEGAGDATTPEEGTGDATTPDTTTPEDEPAIEYPEFVKEDADLIFNAMQDKVDLSVNRDLLGNIRYYIGMVLNWITNTLGFGNYLIGICIFAILIELCMMPLSIKQQKNSIKQAMLRPKEMAIRNRYKGRNDQATQQKVAAEIQDLYQKENFNPMSGCLPMLIQLPIIMILYNIVVDPIQNVLGGSAGLAGAARTFFTTSRAAGGLGMSISSSNGTIELLSQLGNHDLSGLADFALFSNSADVASDLAGITTKIPSFNIGSLNFGYTPSFKENLPLLIVPVLTFVVYFFSMKISKKFTYQPTQNEQAPGAGCSTKAMEFYMPVVSTFFCFMVPGAIGIYWVFRSIISTFKQFIMSKLMPLPKFTEEDYKAAERELNSKKPQRKRKNNADLDPDRERPRSLHHIDDDDEEYITFVK